MLLVVDLARRISEEAAIVAYEPNGTLRPVHASSPMRDWYFHCPICGEILYMQTDIFLDRKHLNSHTREELFPVYLAYVL